MIVLRFGLVHGHAKLMGLIVWIGLCFRVSHIKKILGWV